MTLWRFNNQQGFSLVEVMIGGAILAGVGLAGAMLFRNQTKAQNQLDQDKALAQYHSSVAKLLENNKHCNATIGAIGAASIDPSRDISQIMQCVANCNWDVDVSTMTTSPYISEGNYTDNSQMWQLNDITYVGTTSASGPLRIRMTYNLTPRLGNRRVVRDLIVGVRFGGGTYQGCSNDQQSSVNNLQDDLCKSLTSITSTGSVIAAWNEETQRCELRNNVKDCSAPGMMIEGIRSDGSVHCRTMGTGFNIESGSAFDGTSTSCPSGTTAKLVLSGNRLRVICN